MFIEKTVLKKYKAHIIEIQSKSQTKPYVTY